MLRTRFGSLDEVDLNSDMTGLTGVRHMNQSRACTVDGPTMPPCKGVTPFHMCKAPLQADWANCGTYSAAQAPMAEPLCCFRFSSDGPNGAGGLDRDVLVEERRPTVQCANFNMQHAPCLDASV